MKSKNTLLLFVSMFILGGWTQETGKGRYHRFFSQVAYDTPPKNLEDCSIRHQQYLQGSLSGDNTTMLSPYVDRDLIIEATSMIVNRRREKDALQPFEKIAAMEHAIATWTNFVRWDLLYDSVEVACVDDTRGIHWIVRAPYVNEWGANDQKNRPAYSLVCGNFAVRFWPKKPTISYVPPPLLTTSVDTSIRTGDGVHLHLTQNFDFNNSSSSGGNTLTNTNTTTTMTEFELKQEDIIQPATATTAPVFRQEQHAPQPPVAPEVRTTKNGSFLKGALAVVGGIAGVYLLSKVLNRYVFYPRNSPQYNGFASTPTYWPSANGTPYNPLNGSYGGPVDPNNGYAPGGGPASPRNSGWGYQNNAVPYSLQGR